MSEPVDKSEKKEKIIINLDEAKIKAVSNTYSLYTSLDVEAGKEEKTNITRANVKSKEVESVKSLKPELQKPIKQLLSTVSKEQVKKLINPTEEQKGRLFNKKGANSFGDLSEQEKAILMKKMDDWKVNEEVAEINASVAVSWVNNVGQSTDKPKKNNSKSNKK